MLVEKNILNAKRFQHGVIEPRHEEKKTVFGVSDLVLHNLGFAATADGSRKKRIVLPKRRKHNLQKKQQKTYVINTWVVYRFAKQCKWSDIWDYK